MARYQVKIAKDELEKKFLKYNIWQRIESGQLQTSHMPHKRAKSISKGKSLMRKHFNMRGRHIATTHVLISKNKGIVHQCPHDLIIGDTKYIAED